jgi:phosphoribosylformimino-5-aminoimidazole carboxamide ribotide isomerase
MKILPVLDLKSGVVVRGIAGRRHEYRPVVSQLCQSTTPLDVARAFRDRFGFTEMYIADLDALAGAPPALAAFATLVRDGFALWVDAGIRTPADATPLHDAGVSVLIGGLESLAGPQVLGDLCGEYSADRVLFSLDLKAGMPLQPAPAWQATQPFEIAAEAIGLGVRRVLVLDLARVGVGSGPGTEALCRQIAAAYAHVELAAGGGIRNTDDLQSLAAAGVTTALVASALHDGTFTAPRVPCTDTGSAATRE